MKSRVQTGNHASKRSEEGLSNFYCNVYMNVYVKKERPINKKKKNVLRECLMYGIL